MIVDSKNKSINDLVNYSLQNTLVLTNNIDLRNHIEHKVFSITEFCEYLIKKSPLLHTPKVLSKEESQILIHSLLKQGFKNNLALLNLTKTPEFAKEIYKIFEVFYSLNLTKEKLFGIIEPISLPEEDKVRFLAILDVFDLYSKAIKTQGLLDINELPVCVLELLKKYPSHLEIVRQNCQNILIDEELELTKIQKELFELISSKIQVIKTVKKNKNVASVAIAKKYLKNEMDFEEVNPEIQLLKFSDINDEIDFIHSTIIEKVQKENYKFSDFAIAINSAEVIKLINEKLNLSNIPTNYEYSDESFMNFFMKLNQYFNICYNLHLAKNLSSSVKSQLEELYEEINLNFENIISQTLENQFAKDKFLAILENSYKLSLIECVEENLKILTSEEQIKLKKEIKKINNLSKLFETNQMAQFVAYISQNEEISPSAKEKIAKLIKKINSTQSLLKRVSINSINLQTMQNLLLSITKTSTNKKENCVKFVQLNSNQHQIVKMLFVPNMGENTIPNRKNFVQYISNDANERLTTEFQKLNSQFEGFILSELKQLEDSAKGLINVLSQGEKEIVISFHKYEKKKQIIPSVFFQYLSTIFKLVEKNAVDNNQTQEINATSKKEENNNEVETVITDEETLRLSPSAVSDFLMCPRRFYFSNLLGLKSIGTFSANYGTIVHSILELFNKKYLSSYNKETLLNLTKCLFLSNVEPQNALNIGFSQRSIDLIKATDLLSLEEMKSQFENAVEELEKHNFFGRIPDKIFTERKFEFSHPQVPNVIFNGRIDAIYQYGDEYKIIDFKTGSDKPLLSYLISERGVTFKTPTGRDTNVEIKQKEYEYQIPIYYFASKYSEDLSEFKDKVNSIGLLYVRPKNKHNGSKEDIINGNQVDEFEEKIIQNLKETVITKIRNKDYYESNFDERFCANCSFNSLCNYNAEDLDV